ncbi:hypothetical protein PT974_01774 [Cladobotryum mycophilum]|uniref:Uncharacterized protein n=1 Tax=Cladobotryum mycophilum TaxID=491253 RepID=A0ABR0SXC4_9HYPO
MSAKAPSAGQPGLFSTPGGPRTGNLPLHVLRHGTGLVTFGLLFGFVVPLTPYPRLGLTAHIQFCVEGTMILATGLLLQSDPFSTDAEGQRRVPLADRLGPWQKRLVYVATASMWVTLLSEAANAWWGTHWVLTLAHQAAGLTGSSPAAKWKEIVVALSHWPFGMLLAATYPCVLGTMF